MRRDTAAGYGANAYGGAYAYGLPLNYGYGGALGGDMFGYGTYGYGLYDPYGGFLGGGGVPVLGGGGGSTGTGGTTTQAAPTTNAEWTTQALPQLTAAGYNRLTAITAIGKYLSGRSLTDSQANLIQAALAFEGEPPQSSSSGFPPKIKRSPATGQGKPPGHGKKPTHTITAGGHETLWQIAHNNHISESQLVAWNLNLSKFVGSKRNIPKGTRVKV